ncbi:phospholipid/cholesterol/gamma-HCH transport system substrate-binding protein [Halopolyspora algeriensis]|uniref:Phospholipid/cholesterol/gamma-HCH transport system substrate-binding protein n=1 Tax=Halopolyspora algeriensis TaxID=1500506 RepID=A0A368VZD8_9ACTN|nr:MCE family protein [Halopolyspora algeriensis]RCW46789.1 phospholipid/cholesterol/gamma-HCH transport system substrate-binding protein [Halopolyspora algeriensis]TQM39207.1 phospholipid/cholesterol/gamma-HCH transport system substrate-binding protein [Halopolyspora algeriensis]
MGSLRTNAFARNRSISREPDTSRQERSTGRSRHRALSPARALIAVLATVALVSGCGITEFKGVHSLPLPGGADLGNDPYQVTVRFRDVVDLVPNAGVRVDNVPVGRVSSIELTPKSWQAQVTLSVNGDVDLPANATASIQQSSLLGEKYVELAPPPKSEKPVGTLTDGAMIGIERTGRGPEVEEVLGALSLLLNGGGIAQIKNIASELNAALDGREADVRNLLSNLDELVSELDAQRDEITKALDSVNRLSATLKAQRADIDVALRDLGPGLRVLNEQRDQLVTMLESLDKLSGVATDVVNRTKQDLVANLKSLQPVLRQLAAAGSDLPKSLELLLTYPFTDGAVQGVKGDYTNLYVDADLNLTRVLENLGRSRQPIVHPPESAGSSEPPLPLPLLSGGAGNGQPPATSPGDSPPAPSPDSGSSGGILDSLLGGD